MNKIWPQCCYRIILLNGVSCWCTHPTKVAQHFYIPHCWGGECEYRENHSIVSANSKIPFIFFPVMYLPKYHIFVSFVSYERFDNVTNEEADYILHHAPFPQSIRVIIFVGAVYRAAQTVTKTIIGHF